MVFCLLFKTQTQSIKEMEGTRERARVSREGDDAKKSEVTSREKIEKMRYMHITSE